MNDGVEYVETENKDVDHHHVADTNSLHDNNGAVVFDDDVNK